MPNDQPRQPLSPESIARLRALQGRFADHSATRGSNRSQGEESTSDALLRLRQWALDRSAYGEEIILNRCGVCGAEEYVSPSGRIMLEHRFERHHPTTVPAHEGEAMPVRRAFGESDRDDEEIFGIPTPRRAAGY